MTSSTKATQIYLRDRVLASSPAELRLMLLDGAIRFAEQARRGYESRDFELAYEGTTRAQAILLELTSALRPDQSPELCDRLAALYTYLHASLVTASSTREAASVDEVVRLLRYERETWALALAEIARSNRESSALRDLPPASGGVARTDGARGVSITA